MPTLVLKPNMEIYISKEQQEAVLAFTQSDEEMMTVAKTTFHRSSFAYIKPGGFSAVDAEAIQRIRGSDAARRVSSGTSAIGDLLEGRDKK